MSTIVVYVDEVPVRIIRGQGASMERAFERLPAGTVYLETDAPASCLQDAPAYDPEKVLTK